VRADAAPHQIVLLTRLGDRHGVVIAMIIRHCPARAQQIF
jgi:hypothetical protein